MPHTIATQPISPQACRAKPSTIVLFGILSIAGLSFWFFLGFPFGNHNESYLWMVQLNRMGLGEVLVKGLKPVAGFRPLGAAIAWLGYRLSGGSIYPQQVINYIGAALAWLMLFSRIGEKRLFGWISLLAGGAFFSGYIYLFHIHGVFYSPALMFLAFVLAFATGRGGMEGSRLAVISVVAFLASLFHPFALAFYVAYLVGYFLEHFRLLTRKQVGIGGILIVASYFLVKMLVPTKRLISAKAIPGLLTSYKMVELNPVLSLVSWLLSVVTVISLGTSWKTRLALSAVVTVISFAFVSKGLPVIVIWIATSLLKSILTKKWRIATLIGAAALLPAGSATGSPTYTVFVIMVCSYATALDCCMIEKELVLQNGLALLSIVVILLGAALLKADKHLPIVSRLVNPILSEKEKTFQMEQIIRWMMSSEHREGRLVLCQAAANPVSSAPDAVDRSHRAPTSQDHLDLYIDSLRGGPPIGAEQLMVCFGGGKMENAELVYTVAGKYNGEATVWKTE